MEPADEQAAILLLNLWRTFGGSDSREGMQMLNKASFYLAHRSTYPEPQNPPEGQR